MWRHPGRHIPPVTDTEASWISLDEDRSSTYTWMKRRHHERHRQCVGSRIECIEKEWMGDSDASENTKPHDPSKRIDKLTAKDICVEYSPTIQMKVHDRPGKQSPCRKSAVTHPTTDGPLVRRFAARHESVKHEPDSEISPTIISSPASGVHEKSLIVSWRKL